jgi:tetratricopeptide (TPR) repeat protein
MTSGGKAVSLLEALSARHITREQLYLLGGILSDLLLPGAIRTRLNESLQIVRERGQRLRLRLIIEAREFLPIPWEFLHLPSDRNTPNDLDFLALQPDLSIVRHEVISQREPLVQERTSYRFLAALAAPADQRPIDVETSRAVIERLLQTVKQIGDIQPIWLDNVTRESLQSALMGSEPVDIFHFSGHGAFDRGHGKILLDCGDGLNSDFYGARALANLVRKANVQMAVLDACETAKRSPMNPWLGVASALVRAGLSAVVANQFAIQDRNAITLAEQLYKGVLDGRPIDEAITNARLAIYNQSGLENRDWGSTALFLRVEDGVIFPRATQPQLYATQAPPQTVINVTQHFEGDISGSQISGVSAGTIGVQTQVEDQGQVIPRIPPTRRQVELIGRNDLLAQSITEIESGRKHYFYGTYGVGKTSLATELFSRLVETNRFEDGYLWHRVSEMTVEQVLESVASYLGNPSVAQAQGQEAKINALRRLLSQRPQLLIGLDEVNRAEVAQAILEAAGDCAVILNGPRRARLSGQAKQMHLEPLRPEAAVQLFASIARLDLMQIDTAQQNLIQQICSYMGYLPLAIELAGLTYAEGGDSLESLWQRIQLVPTTLVEGHKEVSTIFETAYQQVQGSATALRMLVRIASFPALEASIAALRDGQSDAEYFLAKDKLGALGLIYPLGPGRLAVHPLLGVLARRRATEQDSKLVEDEQAWVIHWLLEYAREHQVNYQALAEEHANLLGLFDRLARANDQESIVTLTGHLFDYLRVRGHWQEALQHLNDADTAADLLKRPQDQAWIRLYEGVIRILQGDYPSAMGLFDQADALYREQDDLVGQGQVLFRQGIVSALTGELSVARQQLEQALAWMGDAAPARDIAGAHEQLAAIFAMQGDIASAKSQYGLALALGMDAEDREIQARVHRALGQLTRRAGDYASAQAHYQSAIELSEALGYLRQTGMLWIETGYLQYYQGERTEALASYQRAMMIFEKLQYTLGKAVALHGLGNISFAQGDLEAAEARYRQALGINEKLDHPGGAASNRYQLGVISHRQGKIELAKERYETALHAAEEMGFLGLQAACWHQLGRIALGEEGPEVAQEYAKRSIALAQESQNRLTEVSALTLLGRAQLRMGNSVAARGVLWNAYAAFHTLQAPEAEIVGTLLSQLDTELDDAQILPIDVVSEGLSFDVKAVSDSVVQGVDIDVIVESEAAADAEEEEAEW